MNFWEKTYGASRRRKDRALLASVEREIAQAERAAAKALKDNPAPVVSDEERARIARAFGRPA
jgi:acyl dehydratase